jgi:hypothetical protein
MAILDDNGGHDADGHDYVSNDDDGSNADGLDDYNSNTAGYDYDGTDGRNNANDDSFTGEAVGRSSPITTFCCS